jgi:hypothetical protein
MTLIPMPSVWLWGWEATPQGVSLTQQHQAAMAFFVTRFLTVQDGCNGSIMMPKRSMYGLQFFSEVASAWFTAALAWSTDDMSMDEVLHRLTSIDMTDTSISFMMYKVETLNDYTVGHPYQEVLVASQGDCRHGLLKGHTYLLEGVNRRFNFFVDLA